MNPISTCYFKNIIATDISWDVYVLEWALPLAFLFFSSRVEYYG